MLTAQLLLCKLTAIQLIYTLKYKLNLYIRFIEIFIKLGTNISINLN